MRRRLFVLWPILVLLIWSLSGASVWGESALAEMQQSALCTHYVDNHASFDGQGSASKPWDNIAEHVDELRPGDVMCIRGTASSPGRSYTEPGISIQSVNGLATAPITVRSYPGEHVVLHTTGGVALDVGVDYWRFQDLVFDGAHRDQYTIKLYKANHNLVLNCEIYGGNGEAIHIAIGDENVIDSCWIHDVGTMGLEDEPNGTGIMIAGGTSNTIRNNTIVNCRGDGIQVYNMREVSGTIIEGNHFATTLGKCSENAVDIKMGGDRQTIVRGNIMHGYRFCDASCGGSGGGLGEAMLVHMDARNVLVEGNEIYDSATGIRVSGVDVQVFNNYIHDLAIDTTAWANIGIYLWAGRRVDIFNNTLVRLPRYSIWVGIYSSDVEIYNNLFYQTAQVYSEDVPNLEVDYNGWFNTVERLAGPHDVLGGDPRLISSSDFRLQGSSPAVDAGRDTGVAVDFDGQSRAYGARYDMGADEYVPGSQFCYLPLVRK